MHDARRLRLTRVVVLAGIFFGYLSYGTGKLGWGELFPFAHWRLFSAPIGINEPATTYRLYVLDPRSETWRRQPLEPTRAFSRKAQSYVLGYWARKVLEDSSEDSRPRERLRVITRALVPQASSYRVVAETFYSLPLHADPTEYDTSTVARFNW